MLLKILRIRKNIQEARRDPAGFVSGEMRDMVLGILILPALITAIGIIAFFVAGFTNLFGGPYLFFKILFWISTIVGCILFLIIRPIIRFIKQGTKRVVDSGIKEIKSEVI